LAGPPATFVSRGPGGGGAFFAPSVNPYTPDEVWVGSDMSDLFVTRDFGRTWTTIDFRVLQGGSKPGRMLFTSDPLVRYALNDAVPMRSTDGGANWTSIPHGRPGQHRPVAQLQLHDPPHLDQWRRELEGRMDER
jgi:hypothetical protein